MNQKFSWSAFVGGMTTFLGVAAEMLSQHQHWSDFYQSPIGAAHLLIIGAAFTTLVVGALGIKISNQ